MSTLGGGGGSSSDFDKLLSLAVFVQTPEYLDRVKELRDLETSSKEAFEKATAAIDDQQAMARSLVEQRQAHDDAVASFDAARKTHQRDMVRREADIMQKLNDIAAKEKQLVADRSAHDRATAAHSRNVTDKTQELASREAAVKLQENALARDRAALNARIGKLRGAMSDE